MEIKLDTDLDSMKYKDSFTFGSAYMKTPNQDKHNVKATFHKNGCKWIEDL